MPDEVAQGMLAAALEAWDAGLAPIPVRMDFTKRPALEKWNGRTHERFARAEVERLFAEPRALAIVCGAASGGLEMLEVEDVVVQEGNWQRLFDSWPEELRQRVCGGYLEFSPSGGIHVAYRVEGMDVPGNTKLARRPRPDLAPSACDTLIETRGWGGYFVAAPSPGEAHESGNAWELHSGGFGSIATITADEREVLVGSARVFDEMPAEPERVERKPATRTGTGLRPGEDFDGRHTCGEVLERNGWTVVRRRGDEVMWCRPGKSAREGHSGIEHLDEPNRFVNWSSSTTLEVEQGYSAFALYAHLEHGGDFSAAARELGKQGYGEQVKTRREAPAGTSHRTIEPTTVKEADEQIVVGHLDPEQGSANGHLLVVAPADVEYPLGVWPSQIAEFIEQTAHSVCVTPAAVGTAVLAVAASVIGSTRWLDVKGEGGWTERPGIYAGLVGDVSRRKSPALRAAKAPLEALHAEKAAKWNEEHDRWEAEPGTKGEPQLESPLMKDVTTEVLALALKGHPRGVGLVADELIGWLNSMGQYKGGKGNDRQRWIEAWNGDTIDVWRVSRKRIVVENPCVSVVGGVQPDVFGGLTAVKDGLAERFLYCVMPKIQVSAETPDVDRRTRGTWEGIVRALYELREAEVVCDVPGCLTGARQRAVDQLNAAPEGLEGYFGKGETHLVRMAIVLAAVWEVCGGERELSAAGVGRAEDLWGFYADQAARLFMGDVIPLKQYEAASPTQEKAVVAFLEKRGGRATKRELMRGPLQRIRGRDAEETLGALIARGTIWLESGERKDRLVVVLRHGE